MVCFSVCSQWISFKDFGDVDYLNSCGYYMTIIASALTLVVTLELKGLLSVLNSYICTRRQVIL